MLTTATNPESGVTQYVYDANGNLLEKRDQRGGAPALAVCYGTVSGTGASATCDDQGYEVLNRPLRKSYLDGSAAGTFATVTYTYDSHLLPCPSGVSYPVLRLTAVSNAVSTSTNDCFDPLGRITQSTQTTAGGPNSPYLFTYQYNLAGEQTQIKYPSGRIVTTGYDNAARALTLMSASGTNYVTSVTYAPHGAATQMALKNGALIEQNCFNSRLQPEIIRQRTGAPADCGANPDANDLLHLKYVYGVSTDRNNGDIASQTITRGAHAFQQAYTYDTVGRLASAAETAAWSQTYGYDAFGNQWVANGSGFAQGSAPTLFTAGGVGSYDQSNHLTIQSAAYDGVGNQKAIGGYQYVYDGENRMVASALNAPVAYLYDGSGNRVAKVDCATGTPQCTPATGATTTWYIYDAAGQLAAEYDGSPAAAPCTTCYLMEDHLGSTRMMSDGAAIADLHDYLPFGEEIAAGIGGRDGTWGGGEPKLKLTGKLRDDVAESGLDYFGARYFSGAQGRFTSPDEPLGDQYPEDPQSWNLYSYVRNNPLRNTDPTGRDCVTTSNQTETSVSVSVAAGGTEKGCTQSGGAWVAGTVDMKSLTFNGSSIGYSYTPYDTNSLTGGGTIPLGNGPSDALSPSAQEFYNQMSARRESSNHIIAEFGIAQATFAGLYAGTYAGPAVAAWLASGGAAASIRFGQTANQVYHAFRHVQEAGVEIQAAKDAITNDILSKGALPPGLTTGTVNVAGKLLTYNAYKLADGTINVGRVTVK